MTTLPTAVSSRIMQRAVWVRICYWEDNSKRWLASGDVESGYDRHTHTDTQSGLDTLGRPWALGVAPDCLAATWPWCPLPLATPPPTLWHCHISFHSSLLLLFLLFLLLFFSLLSSRNSHWLFIWIHFNLWQLAMDSHQYGSDFFNCLIWKK